MIIKNFAIIAMLIITLILNANLAWGQSVDRERCPASPRSSSQERSLVENRQYGVGHRVGGPVTVEPLQGWHVGIYRIAPSAPDGRWFNFQGLDGLISTDLRQSNDKVAFDHEGKSSYTLPIEAWMQNSPRHLVVSNPNYCNDKTFHRGCGDCFLERVTVTVQIEDVPETPPQPQAPRVTGLHGFLTASWDMVAINPEIISHDVQYRIGALGPFKNGPQGAVGTSATIENLESRFNYQVRIRATNSLGDSPWSANTAANTTPPLEPPVSPTMSEPPPVSPVPIGPPPVSTPPVQNPPVQNPPVARTNPVPQSGPRWWTHAQPVGVTPIIYFYGVDLAAAQSRVHFQGRSAVIKAFAPMRIELVDGLSTHEFALCVGYSRTSAPQASLCTETFLEFPAGVGFSHIWVMPKEPLPAEGGSWVLAAYRIPEENE